MEAEERGRRVISDALVREVIPDRLEIASFVVTKHRIKSDLVLPDLSTVIRRSPSPVHLHPRRDTIPRVGVVLFEKPMRAPSGEKPTRERTLLTYEEYKKRQLEEERSKRET